MNYIAYNIASSLVFTFMHLADAFIQSDLQLHCLYIFISMCVPWESNPQPFALLTQCPTTEPHRNTKVNFLLVYFLLEHSLLSLALDSMYWKGTMWLGETKEGQWDEDQTRTWVTQTYSMAVQEGNTKDVLHKQLDYLFRFLLDDFWTAEHLSQCHT